MALDSVRWGGLRIEPYDPDAKDADADGIVQEGSAWERPLGTRILDDLGREIARGFTADERNPLYRIVDADGNPVDYTPKEIEAVAGGGTRTTLGRLGHPSLAEAGHQTVLDTNAAAYAESLKPYAERLPADASDATRWYFEKQDLYLRALRAYEYDPEFIAAREKEIAEVFEHRDDYIFHKGSVVETPTTMHSYEALAVSPQAYLGGFEAIAVPKRPRTQVETSLDVPVEAPDVTLTAAELERQARLAEVTGPDLPYTPGEIVDEAYANQRLADLRLRQEQRARVVLMNTFGANYADGPADFEHMSDWDSNPLSFDLDDAWWDGPIKEHLNLDMTRRQLADALMAETGTDSLEGITQAIVAASEGELRDEWARRSDDDIVISYGTAALLPILRTGRIKSQFETNRSHGELDPDKRAEAEQRLFGVPVDIDRTLRPIYGHLDVREEGETISKLTGSSYGDRAEGIHIVLRPKVRARSTMTHGDSLAASGPIAVSMKDSDISAERGLMASTGAMREHVVATAFSRMLDRASGQDSGEERAVARADSVFKYAHAEGFGSDTPTTLQELADKYPSLKKYYFEAQIHGGVSTDDIAYVVIPDEDNGYTEDIMTAAAERGIPVLRHSEATKLGRSEANASAASEPASSPMPQLVPLNAEGEPLDVLNMSDAELDALHVSPRTKAHREEYLVRKARVEATHGPIKTSADARVAIARAFPLLSDDAAQLTFREGINPSISGLTPRETGWVYGLLALAEEHPTIANNLISLKNLTGNEEAWAYASVQARLDEEQILPRYGFGLDWVVHTNDPGIDSAAQDHIAQQITDARSNPARMRETLSYIERALEFHPYELSLADMLLDPRIPDREATEFAAMQVALHEWGHLLDYEARLQDRGLSLNDRQDRTWLLEAYGGGLLESGVFEFDPLMSQAELDTLGARFRKRRHDILDRELEDVKRRPGGHKVHLLLAHKDDETKYDNLSTEAKIEFESFVRRAISRYAQKNDWETIAELWSVMVDDPSAILKLADTESERVAIQQVFDWLNGNRDARHATRRIRPPESLIVSGAQTALTPAERLQRAQLELTMPEGATRIAWQVQDELSEYVLPDVFIKRLRAEVRELREELANPNISPERQREIVHGEFGINAKEKELREWGERRLRKIDDLLESSTEDEVYHHERAQHGVDIEVDSHSLRQLTEAWVVARERSRALEEIRNRLRALDSARVESELADDRETLHAVAMSRLIDGVDQMGPGQLAKMRTNVTSSLENSYQELFEGSYRADDRDEVDAAYGKLLRMVQEQIVDYQIQLVEWRRQLRNGGRSLTNDSIARTMFAFAVRMDYSQFLLNDFIRDHGWEPRDYEDIGAAGVTFPGVPQGETTTQLLDRIAGLQPLDRATIDELVSRNGGTVGRKQYAFDEIEVKSADTSQRDDRAANSGLCTGYGPSGIMPIGRVRYNLELLQQKMNVKQLPWPYATKVNRYWKDGFRLAPYDPDAIDADGDGIVQEGTVWERPVGTRWVDEAGRDIARGLQTPAAHPNRSLVDKDNKPVTYTPRGGSGQVSRGLGELLDQKPNEGTPQYEAPKPKPPSSALGQIGHPTIGELGAQIVAEAVAPTPPPPPKPVKKAKKPAKAKKDLSQWHGSLFSRLSRFGRDQQNEIRKGFRAQAKMTIEQATARGLEIFLNASPEARERGESWYRRVRGHLEEAGKQKRQTLEVMAGVLAATSQRMTWYNKELGTYPNWNVAMATVDLWNENQLFTITEQRMQDLLASTQNDMVAAQSKLATLTATPVPDDAKAAQARAKKIAAAEARIAELQARIDKSFGLHVGQKISLHDLLLDDEKEGALVAADLLSEDVRQRAGAQVMQIPLAAALRVLSSGDIDKLRGPKIRSFADNLLQGGEGEAITIDVWMARILTGIDGIELDRGGGPGTKFRGQFDTEFLDKDGNEVGPFNIYPAFAEIVARITDLWNLRHPNEQYTAAQVQAILWETALEQGI